jgi:hypothetical protein
MAGVAPGYSVEQPEALYGNFKSHQFAANKSSGISSNINFAPGQPHQYLEGPVQTLQAAPVPVYVPSKAALKKQSIMPSADQGLKAKFDHASQQATVYKARHHGLHFGADPNLGNDHIKLHKHQQYYQVQTVEVAQQPLVMAAHAQAATTAIRPEQPAAAGITDTGFIQQQQQFQVNAEHAAALQPALQPAAEACFVGATGSCPGSQDSSNMRWLEKMASEDLECSEELVLQHSFSFEAQRLAAEDNMEDDAWDVGAGSSCNTSSSGGGYPSAKARLDFAMVSVYNDMNSPKVLAECNIILQGLQLPGRQVKDHYLCSAFHASLHVQRLSLNLGVSAYGQSFKLGVKGAQTVPSVKGLRLCNVPCCLQHGMIHNLSRCGILRYQLSVLLACNDFRFPFLAIHLPCIP